MDMETDEIRVVEFTSSRQGDSTLLMELLEQISEDKEVAIVIADGAYEARRCHATFIAHGAHAVIPIRLNGRAWKQDALQPRLETRSCVPREALEERS